MDERKVAKQSRIDILNMTKGAKAGFIGSDYSCVDLLATIYAKYFDDAKDRMILSKGHAAAAWYAVLANTGRIDRSMLWDFNVSGKNMGAHPKRRSLPQIEASTGSLGQGVGLASGAALGEKLAGTDGRVYTIVGDGEANEGSVWETVMFAAKRKLDNLYVFLDRNHLQSYGREEEVLDIADYGKKFSDFGWDVQTINGHSYIQIGHAIENAKNRPGRPHAIVAETIKGKGVSEFENKAIWHYKFPDGEVYNRALQELRI